MTIKLIFDTNANITPNRLKELQEKGITLEDRMNNPKEKLSIKPSWTRIYDDGYETSLRDLGHTGIVSSTGNLSVDSVKTNIDMILYSASHQKYYYFKRSVEFTQGNESVEGHFK